jgi:hypothetical protein
MGVGIWSWNDVWNDNKSCENERFDILRLRAYSIEDYTIMIYFSASNIVSARNYGFIRAGIKPARCLFLILPMIRIKIDYWHQVGQVLTR